MEVLFNKGCLAEVVSIGLINDDIVEPTEKFEIKIIDVISTSSLNHVGIINEAFGIIRDDDGNNKTTTTRVAYLLLLHNTEAEPKLDL